MADALGFLALGFDQAFDFDLELPAGLVEADVFLVGIIAALTWFQLDGLKFQGSRSSIYA